MTRCDETTRLPMRPMQGAVDSEELEPVTLPQVPHATVEKAMKRRREVESLYKAFEREWKYAFPEVPSTFPDAFPKEMMAQLPRKIAAKMSPFRSPKIRKSTLP